jgi:hypothetical protein
MSFKEEFEEWFGMSGWAVAWRCLVAITVIFAISSIVYVGSLYVERKALETSFQYHESVKSQTAMFEAQLAEIQVQLLSSIDEQTRVQLKAQESAIKIRLTALKKMEE